MYVQSVSRRDELEFIKIVLNARKENVIIREGILRLSFKHDCKR